MSDFSNQYTDAKNARIYLARNNNIIYFKPFLDNLEYQKETTNITINDFFATISLTDSAKESRKISFKVLASNRAEAMQNHKKFQTLLRMIAPDNQNKSFVFIKFSNLLHNFAPIAKTSFTFQEVVDSGLKGFCSNLEYKPELDLGFFDDHGMFFAKAFTISLDLRLEEIGNGKKSKEEMDQMVKNPQADDVEFYPGKMFGFSVPINNKSGR